MPFCKDCVRYVDLNDGAVLTPTDCVISENEEAEK